MNWDSGIFIYVMMASLGIYPAIIYSVVAFVLALVAYRRPKDAVMSFWVGLGITGLVAVISMAAAGASLFLVLVSFVATLIPPLVVFHLVAAPLVIDRSGKLKVKANASPEGGSKPPPDVY